VLAAGPGAALSHRDAAALHGLGRWRTSRIEVTTAGRASAPGLQVHARRVLDPSDVTAVGGIPVTTIERTLVDLAEALTHDRLAHALSEAERRRVVDAGALRAAIARVAHRPGPGHALLRAVLAEHARRGVTLTRHELEIAFRALVRDHRLPEPELNAWIDGDEVDAVWRVERVAVECDGWETHRGRRAFQRDRTKGNDLTPRGWRLLRFTHADVIHRPADVAARIRTALRAPA
jgi:very-short-patch-repair endonuclease